jgi:hypothetical protein
MKSLRFPQIQFRGKYEDRIRMSVITDLLSHESRTFVGIVFFIVVRY